MPPRKVYGKSRAAYDPLTFFDSPQRPPQRGVVENKNNQVKYAKPGLAVVNDEKREDRHGTRTALGEVNVNRTVLPQLPLQKNAKTPTKRIGRLVVEDSEDEGSEREEDECEGGRESSTKRWNTKSLRKSVEDVLFRTNSHESGREDVVFREGLSSDPQCREQETAGEVPQHIFLQDGLHVTAESPPMALDEYDVHCSDLLAQSCHGMTSFSDWSDQLSSHFNITKIAEASFGEVYRLSLTERHHGFSSNDESVFKVIPLRPPANTLPTEKRKRAAALKKVESMSSPSDVANEVKLLQQMNDIPGFTNFRDVRVISGRPPEPFVSAFKEFNALQKERKKELSLFPDPSKKASYSDDQLWAVIEMQDAGTDLEQLVEKGECTSMWLVWDIFWQIVLSLAKAEECAEFEHRDLHLGNICVRMPLDPEASDYDPKRKVSFTGVETTIIDYTISRARMQDETIAFHDLAADATLFEGDSTEEYQYEIYRQMRGAVLQDEPHADFTKRKQREDRSWEQFHPITNLIWLHYILYKLLEQVEWPSATKAPPRRQKEDHVKWKRANDLEHILLRVSKVLDPDQICLSLLESTSDLVKLALSECWLDTEDVVGRATDESAMTEQFQALDVGGAALNSNPEQLVPA